MKNFENYHDPIMENPLKHLDEWLIDRADPRRMVAAFIEKGWVKLSGPVGSLTDHECRKICRIVFRSCVDYDGVETKQ